MFNSLFKRIFAVSILFLLASVAVFAQDHIDPSAGSNPTQVSLIQLSGMIYSGLVVLVTALGHKFNWFTKIDNKWLWSVAVASILGLAWILMGLSGFLDLLTKYFPIAGTLYQTLKTLGLLKLIGLEPKTV